MGSVGHGTSQVTDSSFAVGRGVQIRAKLGDRIRSVLAWDLWEVAPVTWANHATFRVKQQPMGRERPASLNWVPHGDNEYRAVVSIPDDSKAPAGIPGSDCISLQRPAALYVQRGSCWAMWW